ncbi:MAG: hypothetical protein HY688_00115 [Chloroflexi bacterium]|nr:hypothetical protein [Chloroflexota bacterium]
MYYYRPPQHQAFLPKTKRARRTIPLPVVTCLRSHHARQLAERLRAASLWEGDE